MKHDMQCASCGESYSIDLDKYGGKNIRCKKCKEPMTIPTAAELEDEFEVVDDDEPAPPEPAPSKGPALQRNRTASKRGAVNIALLQRSESSREEIRNNYLAIHGDDSVRAPDVFALQQQAVVAAGAAEEAEQKLAWFKEVYSRALAVSRPELLGGNLTNVEATTKLMTFGLAERLTSANPTDENAYGDAVSLVGHVSESSDLPTSDLSIGFGLMPRALKPLVNKVFKLNARDQKLATVQAGIEKLEKEIIPEKQKEKEKMLAQAAQTEAEAQARIAERMNGAMGLLANEQGAEAAELLQSLVKTAPVKSLGQLLVGLSQCAYFTGNSMDSAKNVQDAICFGANSPQGMDPAYNDLWAKAASGLPKM
jgi:hypothetical protein